MINKNMKRLIKDLTSKEVVFPVVDINDFKYIFNKLKTDKMFLMGQKRNTIDKAVNNAIFQITGQTMEDFKNSKSSKYGLNNAYIIGYLNTLYDSMGFKFELDSQSTMTRLGDDTIGLYCNGELYCYLLKDFNGDPVVFDKIENVPEGTIFADVDFLLNLVDDDDYLKENILSVELTYTDNKDKNNPFKNIGSRCELKKFIKHKKRPDIACKIETTEAVKAYFEALSVLEG